MHNIKADTVLLNSLIEQTKKSKDLYRPFLFKLSNAEDRAKFDELLLESKGLEIFDTIKEQVFELLKCLNPLVSFTPKNELENVVTERLGKSEEYGIWVYYPWSNKLVHLLDEDEFVIVRTNRNKHKITEEEQQILSTKKIGVIGLSVGQSVALTLAMERGFGELRIADFDELDLSNINRIRTAASNIGLKKTVIVAREIAEIDPFLKVVCFDNGITDDNILSFLTGNGKLDLLIDECDSFDIKISARKIAKELQIPVLMEGSDRGTIDIERFDLDPQRPILHGMVEHLDMDKFKELKTFDERVPYITAVTGLETLSPRMKASAVELMATISTWPQLASAVTFGGGVSADLSRKILLNSLKVSGRFFLDLDEMISDEVTDLGKNIVIENKEPLSTPDIQMFIKKHNMEVHNEQSKDLTDQQLFDLIEAAKKAPSGGNNQPWRWHYQDKKLHLFLDESSALAYLDPQFISSYTSIGCAIENLLLAAAVRNLKVQWTLTPQLAPTHVAVFQFFEGGNATEEELLLEKQIPLRHTNRKSSSKEEIKPDDVKHLTKLITETEGANITFLTDPTKIKLLAAIAAETDLLRMFIPEAHEDFITREMRWTPEEANTTEDGIGIHTLDLSNNDQLGIRLLRDRRTVEILEKIEGGSVFNRLLMQQFTGSSAIGLITMPKSDVSAWIDAGIAAERMWLGATSLGYQIHPINVPIIFFYKNSVEKNLTLSNDKKEKLRETEKEFNLIFNKQENQTSMFMFRIFKADASSEKTIRKSNAKIFSVERS